MKSTKKWINSCWFHLYNVCTNKDVVSYGVWLYTAQILPSNTKFIIKRLPINSSDNYFVYEFFLLKAPAYIIGRSDDIIGRSYELHKFKSELKSKQLPLSCEYKQMV